jgi:CRISPR/Cas system-associated endoribonuclease Cas2
MNNSGKFLFITYSLPSEPSRIRVHVWRWLKKTGALNMQQSLWLLPDTVHNQKILEKLEESIERDGGSVYIVSGHFVHGTEGITGRFNGERDVEYMELLEYCFKFHDEMRMETEASNFSFAELEENEQELRKLFSWLEKIRKRDYFSASMGEEAYRELDICRSELEAFTDRVYEINNMG